MATSYLFTSTGEPAAPVLYDATEPTDPAKAGGNQKVGSGGCCTGIGLTGADGAALPGAKHIGGLTTPIIKFDTDANVNTP